MRDEVLAEYDKLTLHGKSHEEAAQHIFQRFGVSESKLNYELNLRLYQLHSAHRHTVDD